MRRTASCAAVLAATALTVFGLTAPARGAGPVSLGPAPDCSTWTGLPDGATFYAWTGVVSDQWDDPGNWLTPAGIPDKPPGTPRGTDTRPTYLTEDTDYACIADATVSIPHGTDFAVGAFALLGTATVDLAPGTRLFANAAGSSIDPAAALFLDGATLGGSGMVTDSGSIEMYSTWDDQANPQTPAASAQTTRFCQSKCSGVPSEPAGVTDVAAGGSLLIDAPIDPVHSVGGGVNVGDRRQIVNSGTITLSKDGYIAADNGTTIVNAAGGTINIANDNGIYQGFTNTGPDPAQLRNHGLVEKTAGNGTSIIGIDFQELSNGQVKVQTGTLSINGTNAPTATVRQGSTYATGACVPSAGATCHARTVPAKSGIAAVTLPSAPGSGDVSIVVSKTSPSAVPKEHLTASSATFSRTKPLGYVLTYRHSIAAGLNKVAVEPNGGTSYATIPSCPNNTSHVPSGAKACLISRTHNSALKEVIFKVIGIVPDGRWIIR